MRTVERLVDTLASPVPLGWMLVLIVVLLLLIGVARAGRLRDRREQATRAKSAEVRLGHVVESLAPLLDDFPVDVTKPGTATVFLGQPFDYLHFDPEAGLFFIEVKSGGSQLSPRQRQLRDAVEAGAVRWLTYRRR